MKKRATPTIGQCQRLTAGGAINFVKLKPSNIWAAEAFDGNGYAIARTYHERRAVAQRALHAALTSFAREVRR